MSDEQDPTAMPPPILNYADATTGQWVVIARFREESEARLAAGRLDADGIEAVVTDQIPSRALGNRAATLSVLGDEMDQAIEILRQTPARSSVVT